MSRYSPGNEPIRGNVGAFAARLNDGSVACWGHRKFGGSIDFSVQSRLKNVKALSASWGELGKGGGGAFAAIVGDDTVVCWGHRDFGGDCSAVARELKEVELVCGSQRAFAALKRDGTVATWGDEDCGGDSYSVRGRLKGVKAIYSTYCAFAAVLHDGSVETWGDPEYGGVIPPSIKARLKQVKCISGTSVAFAALLRDGTVETWGSEDEGGDSSELRDSNQLREVESICASFGAFAALKKNGTVVSWGVEARGGVCPVLEGVVALSSNDWAFAALKSDGSVATWGDRAYGGDCSSAVGELKEVVAIRGALFAFAALKKDGTVATWGDKCLGGDISAVRSELVGVVAISSNGQAFAAQRSNGTVVTWGWEDYGGDISSVPALRKPGAIQVKVAPHPQALRANNKLNRAEESLFSESKHEAPRQVASKEKAQQTAEKSPTPEMAIGNASPVFAASASSQSLPRISEEELAMEEVVGEGAFSMVWRATWTRKIAVGTQRMHSLRVAVKMSNKASNSNNNLFRDELARDLAVISGLPHQNILTVHGVCEPKGGGSLRIVYELMTTDLAKLLRESLDKQHRQERPQQQLLPTHVLLRVLRDVSAGLAHLHANGVVHRDVKPANVLLREGEQVKLCDFGSSRDLQQSIMQMSVAGTLDYMAPEVLNRQPVGRPADVWSFGVLLFECVTGQPCGRAQSTEELKKELSQRKCLPALVQLFMECHQSETSKRPSMLNLHTRLQTLVMQEARDSQRLKQELKRAEAQDKDTYETTWNSCYANQASCKSLLDYLKGSSQSKLVVQQSLKLSQGKGSMEELEQLASGRVCARLHAQLKAMVEECGGTYLCAPRKSHERCVQKVGQEYEGDYSKLLDLERATGLFEQAEDLLRCLQRLREQQEAVSFSSSSSSSAFPSTRSFALPKVVRCKDRMNSPLPSGYRDLLLNVCEAESGFIMELQLNFHKIAQIKSQSHRFYELLRVMKIKLE